MKTATIFLVAVTAFTGLLQQAIAAPLFGSLGDLFDTVDDTLGTTIKDLGDLTDTLLKTPDGEVDKPTEDIDSILSKLKHKATESQTKTNGAAGKTNNEFKSLITELIDKCNASLQHIIKALDEAITTATCRKKQGLNKAKKWLDAFEAKVKEMHNDLKEAADSDDINKLEGLKTRMTKAISETKADFPDFLANLDSGTQEICKKHMENIINVAETCVVEIEKHVSGQ